MDASRHGEGRELEAPRYAAQDDSASEVMRVWTGQTEYVSLTHRLYKDPGTWGHLLCQVARHVANSYQLNGYGTREDVLAAIRTQLLETWGDPSTDVSDGFVSET